MMTMRTLLSCLSLAALLVAQDPEPPQPKAEKPEVGEQDPIAQMQEIFAKSGIVLDREAKTVSIPCVFGEPTDPVEFLLIHPRGKAHESVLMSEVQGSVLNAALIALGYQKGENVRIVQKDPMPTEEEVAAGAAWFDLFPPKGQQVWITLKWQYVDDDGEKVDVEIPVEDLILDLATGRPIEDSSFIYIGGQMAPIYRGDPPVFVADYEGNYVSSVYKPQPNHLITVKHEAANDDQRWWVTERMQPRDKPATLVFHATETKLHKERRERIEKERKAREAAGEPDTLPEDERQAPPREATGGGRGR